LPIFFLNVIRKPIAQEVQQVNIQREFSTLKSFKVFSDLPIEIAVLDPVLRERWVLRDCEHGLFRSEVIASVCDKVMQ
jgi:hypothetical protein